MSDEWTPPQTVTNAQGKRVVMIKRTLPDGTEIGMIDPRWIFRDTKKEKEEADDVRPTDEPTD